MPYIESTMDEFLEAANESFGVKKKSVNELLATAEKKLNKQLQTVGDCDDQLLIINNEGRKFNECIKALSKVKKDFDQGKLNKKQFSEQVKAANYLLKKNCKALQMQLGNLVDDSKAVTSEELADFKAYLNGLRKIVKARKAILSKVPAKESYLDDFDRVLEGELTLADLEAEEDEKLKKKDKKSDDEDSKDDSDSDNDEKSKKKNDDESEDDFKGEPLDDEDDKKKKKKDKDDEDDSDDDEDDDKKSKDDKEDSDDDEDKDDSDKKDEDDKSDSKDDKDDDKSDKKSDDKEDSDDEDKEDDKKDSKKSDKDDDFDLSDLDFDDDDDKKDKKKDKKSDDDEDKDKEDAKESVNTYALELMSEYCIDYDEAVEVAYDLFASEYEDFPALESLGFVNDKKAPPPSTGKQIARGVGLGVLLGPAGIVAGAALSGRDIEKKLELSMTSELDSHETEITNLINKLRKSISCPEFSSNEVTTSSSNLHNIVILGKAWLDKHKPATIISIPVVKNGYDPSKSKIYNKWVKEINAVCSGITFTETSSITKSYRIYAEYNPRKFSIDINFSA